MIKHSSVPQVGAFHNFIAQARIPLFRNVYVLMISTAATSGLGLYWILAARFYPPEVVGVNAAVVSMMTFLAGLAQMPSMNAILRYVPVAGTSAKKLILWAYLFSTAVAFLITGLYLLSIDIWSPTLAFLRDDPWLVAWFLLGVVTWCVFALQDNVLTGLRKAVYVPIENIPYAIAKIALVILFAASIPTYGILASWTAPLFVVLVPVNFLIFARLVPRFMAANFGKSLTHGVRQIGVYVAGNYVGAMFLLAATRLLPVVVATVAGGSATAFFYLPWTIATSLKLVVANMMTSFTVEVSADWSRLQSYSRRFVVHTMKLLIGPVLLLILGGPYILSVSGTEYAAQGTQLLRLLSLAALPNIISSLYIGIARAQQNVTRIMLLQFVLCALTLGLSYPLLTHYGITGVGIAVLVSETIVAIVTLLTGLWPILCAPLLLRLLGQPARPAHGSGD